MFHSNDNWTSDVSSQKTDILTEEKWHLALDKCAIGLEQWIFVISKIKQNENQTFWALISTILRLRNIG